MYFHTWSSKIGILTLLVLKCGALVIPGVVQRRISHVNVKRLRLSPVFAASVINAAHEDEELQPMRPRLETSWSVLREELKDAFGLCEEVLQDYDEVETEALIQGYEMMQFCRQFENACAQAYMQGSIRGFMHLDNGQETIPALVADRLVEKDIKYSYYREHTHALSSGVPAEKIMAELFAKDTGTCRGAGGSMHIFDKQTNFQGGWALVAEQLPYAVGAARSILLDGIENDDRITVVFVGEGGAQNGRLAECLNAAAKESLPILFLIIDNGRAINTYTPDVAQNSDINLFGKHYGVPGAKIDGQDLKQVLQTGRCVIDYVRKKRKPAILQVHTYRFQGHSPADPEHERGRKFEKKWARIACDPLSLFEDNFDLDKDMLNEVKQKVKLRVQAAVNFAKQSPPPPPDLAKELEYPDPPDTDYNVKPLTCDKVPLEPVNLSLCEGRIADLRERNQVEGLVLGDAINLAILEEMIRDPSTTIHAEDLQAGSSYDIPKLTQQSFGVLRAADEIIDEGHFIGKALGEGMNGYRPIVELMNANFGIYGMAELSSAGNTYATTGGQFKMPLTVLGAGGTAPNQALGAEHSQPFHAYVMGIPGLKICTASSAEMAYGLVKSMIRDDGPGILFLPVKLMKDEKRKVLLDHCLPLNKCKIVHESNAAPEKSVTVVTYLHGVREAITAIPEIQAQSYDIDLIELHSLKPLDLEIIAESLKKTHKLIILDESTYSGGVGATISAAISENLYDLLDGPIKRLAMDDAPVPYASSMEEVVVKRASDLVKAVSNVVNFCV
mmetsp:Transcript_20399/g.26454  ORF Transcript_20399/g.26454 Transcript_20399/m.26454 type:complete len:785 (-) Transcript_20399:426-2780(-)